MASETARDVAESYAHECVETLTEHSFKGSKILELLGLENTLWIPCINALDKWRNCSVSLVCAMCIKLLQNTSSMVQNGFPSNKVKNLLHLLGLGLGLGLWYIFKA